jgi:hypothetical protein
MGGTSGPLGPLATECGACCDERTADANPNGGPGCGGWATPVTQACLSILDDQVEVGRRHRKHHLDLISLSVRV